jgi:chromosome segregation ATPase
MNENLEDRLKRAVTQREKLATEVSRLEARRDLATKTLLDLEAEIRAKGIDPEDIEAAVERLEASFKAALEKFESDLSELDNSLSPYRNL